MNKTPAELLRIYGFVEPRGGETLPSARTEFLQTAPWILRRPDELPYVGNVMRMDADDPQKLVAQRFQFYFADVGCSYRTNVRFPRTDVDEIQFPPIDPTKIVFALQSIGDLAQLKNFPRAIYGSDENMDVAYQVPAVQCGDLLELVHGVLAAQNDARVNIVVSADASSPGGAFGEQSMTTTIEEDIFHRTTITSLLPLEYPAPDVGCVGDASGLARLGFVYTVRGVKSLEDVLIGERIKENNGVPFDVTFASMPDFTDFRQTVGNLASEAWAEFKSTYIYHLICRVRLIIDNAVRIGNTHLLLSALGCGDYANNPYLIAAIFRLILAERAQDITRSGLIVEIVLEPKLQHLSQVFVEVLSHSLKEAVALLRNQYILPVDGYFPLLNMLHGRPATQSISIYNQYVNILRNPDMLPKIEALTDILDMMFAPMSQEDASKVQCDMQIRIALLRSIGVLLNIAVCRPNYLKQIQAKILPVVKIIFNIDSIVDLEALSGCMLLSFYGSMHAQEIYTRKLCTESMQQHSLAMVKMAFPLQGEIFTEVHNYFLHNEELRKQYKQLCLHVLHDVYGLSYINRPNGLMQNEVVGGWLEFADNDFTKLQALFRILLNIDWFGFRQLRNAIAQELRRFLCTGEGASLLQNFLRSEVQTWLDFERKRAGFTLFVCSIADTVRQGWSILRILDSKAGIYIDAIPADLIKAMNKAAAPNDAEVCSPARLLSQIIGAVCELDLVIAPARAVTVAESRVFTDQRNMVPGRGLLS